MLIGPDCALKTELTGVLEAKLINLIRLDFERRDSSVPVRSAYTVLDLRHDASAYHHMRHSAVAALREAGAKSVVGIWVMLRDDEKHGMRAGDIFVAEDLEKNPPTPDGLEGLFCVTHRE